MESFHTKIFLLIFILIPQKFTWQNQIMMVYIVYNAVLLPVCALPFAVGSKDCEEWLDRIKMHLLSPDVCCWLLCLDITRSALLAHKVQNNPHRHQAGEHSAVLHGRSCAQNCSRSCGMAAAWHQTAAGFRQSVNSHSYTICPLVMLYIWQFCYKYNCIFIDNLVVANDAAFSYMFDSEKLISDSCSDLLKCFLKVIRNYAAH